jgi:polyhydroxybutyrate depolymerase
VSYLLGLLDEVEAAIPIDPDRVTILGHSNGGFMAYRLACEAPERFAGIASLAGSTFPSEASCAATEPVAVLQMHGTVDDTIAYDGVPFAYPGAEETVARWAERAGCAGGPTDGATHDYDTAVAGAETVDVAYSGCERDVRLWRMEGSGHIPLPSAAYPDDLRAWLLAR